MVKDVYRQTSHINYWDSVITKLQAAAQLPKKFT
jgi:hypothetical protein